MDLNLCIVRNEIHDARAKWYDIGIQLKIDLPTLRNIKSTYTDNKDCLREVLTEWLRADNPKPTWKALVDALKARVIDEQKLAADLEAKFCSCSTESEGLLTSSDEHGPWSKSHSPLEKSESLPQLPEPSPIPRRRSKSVPDDIQSNTVKLCESHSTSPVEVTLPFPMPYNAADFWNRVYTHNVLLEKASFSDEKLSVVGDVIVTNLTYEKEVSVLCTWNDWSKHFEVRAEFNGHREDADVFTFELPICFTHKDVMKFMIRYKAGGKVFWDNNRGKDYHIRIKFPTHANTATP